MWVAWWTAPPAREPFRKPDAFSGGARSHEEALAQARRAAGVTLVEIEAYWARAWARVLIGRPPWGVRAEGEGTASSAQARSSARSSGRSSTATTDAARATTTSIWETLGITARATADELKRAFRRRALATHPDRGGDAEAFRQVQRAFKEAQRRIAAAALRAPGPGDGRTGPATRGGGSVSRAVEAAPFSSVIHPIWRAWRVER